MSPEGHAGTSGPLSALARTLMGVVLIAYPFMVYLGLTRFTARSAALALLVLMLPAAALRLRRIDGQGRVTLLLIPAVVALALGMGALMDHAGYVLMVPVAVNLGLLTSFASTLRGGPSMIERFAQLQVQDLSPDELGWCRTWTWIWCVFFTANGLAALALALAAPLAWWTLYNGLLAYGLIGLLCAGEYVLRKRRFGRFSDTLLDRLLATLLRRRRGGP